MKKTRIAIFILILISIFGCQSKTKDVIKSKEENIISKDFELTVEDVFSLSNGKIIITGKVDHGKVYSNESITWFDSKNKRLIVEIEEMNVFAKVENTDVAEKDEYVSFTVSGVSKADITHGIIVSKLEKEE